MAPIRRSTSSVPAPKKASTIRETPRQSLFGTSKPSSSSLKKSTTADSKNSKSVKNLKGVQGAKGEGGEGGRSEKEWERDYRDLVRESKRRMGEPSHAMKAIQIVLQCVLSFPPFIFDRFWIRRCWRGNGGSSEEGTLMEILGSSVWDSSDEYGPVIGLTRLERFVIPPSPPPLALILRANRWERSEKMGLAPPPEVG